MELTVIQKRSRYLDKKAVQIGILLQLQHVQQLVALTYTVDLKQTQNKCNKIVCHQDEKLNERLGHRFKRRLNNFQFHYKE